MTPKLITALTVFITSFCMSINVAAQQHIESVITRLEKDPKITVTYTERRDPKTHKITKQSTILNGNAKKDADALWKAFDADRSNSIMVSKTKNQSFIIKFLNNDILSTYVLSVSGTNWTLVITKRPAEDDDYDLSLNGLYIDGQVAYDALKQLDQQGLSCLTSVAVLEGLSNLQQYMNSFNSENNITKNKAKTAAKAVAKAASHSTSTSMSVSSNVRRTVTTIKNSNGKTIAMVSTAN